MRNLPLPLKLQINYSSEQNLVEERYSAGDTLVEDTAVDFVNTELKLIYPSLTLEEALTVETELLATRGVERLLFNGRKYLIKEEYDCTIKNTLVRLELNLVDVTGGNI